MSKRPMNSPGSPPTHTKVKKISPQQNELPVREEISAILSGRSADDQFHSYLNGNELILQIPSSKEFILKDEVVSDDDPAFFVHFFPTRLEALAAAVATLPAASALKASLFLTAPHTQDTVQNDIMAYLVVNHAGGHQGRCGCMIAPNTKVEFSFIHDRVAYAMIIAGQLGLTIPNGPVGRVFIIHDRKHMTTPVMNPVAPVIIPGVQLFE